MARRVAAPEVEVPDGEVAHVRSAALVVAPVLERQRHISPVDREPFVGGEVPVALGDLAEDPRLDERAAGRHDAGASRATREPPRLHVGTAGRRCRRRAPARPPRLRQWRPSRRHGGSARHACARARRPPALRHRRPRGRASTWLRISSFHRGESSPSPAHASRPSPSSRRCGGRVRAGGQAPRPCPCG